MTTVPYWLQALLGVVSLLFPQFAWIKLAIELAYEIWQVIPWFHKAGALVELRKTVTRAKKVKSDTPVREWCSRWKGHCEALGKYPG